MVRFSCFHTNLHSNRSKREVQPSSAEAMSKASEDYSHSQWVKVSDVPNSSPQILYKTTYDSPSNTNEEQDASSPREHCQESGEMHSDSSQETNIQVHQKTGLKKSQSLGSALEREGRVTDSEDEFDQDFPCDRSDEKNYARLFEGFDRSVVEKPFDCNDHNTNLRNKHGKALVSESYQGNNKLMGNLSIFSIEESKQFEEGDKDMANRLAYEYAGESGQHSPAIPPVLAKSCSFPDFDVLSPVPNDGSPSHVHTVHRCRSSEDLNALDEKRKAMEDQDRDNGMLENTKNGDRYEYESYCNHGGELSVQNLNALHSKDFKIKRIEEWVSTIDLEDSNSLQEKIESSQPIDTVNKGSYALGSASSTPKMDSKSTHGMEAAKKYVSTLRATSTSAQLANLGLVVVPFLSAFVSLKTLNLSGNAIVRITSGALPRGLHVLNLSKNNISTIEGLRELTRLRVLDLSYNRILRIGHGLASCSSLKELYLAGNKISEVEGLHRLLKLNVLDLRFNKISTAKCLGQLAANYSSLQAINLEGNPAQRNVGDEHLKKYLQSILPHLVYFNKQTVRASSSKEVVDRSTRSAISSHPSDRGSRSEHKLVRKGSHPLSVGKTSSSSYGHRAQAVNSSKQSKDRHGRLPPNPSGTRGSHRHNYLDLGSKLQELRSNLSLRRSRSEGNLGDS